VDQTPAAAPPPPPPPTYPAQPQPAPAQPTAEPTAASGTRPGRTPRASGWVLRGLLTLLAVACVAQPLFIGRYLDGDYDAIGLHSGNAVLLVLLTTAAGAAATVWWRSGGHPVPLLLLVALWFAIGFQMGVGYTRNLTVHIPLGVGIVASSVALAGWSWTRRAFRGAP
jgi:hypothetical protein